MFEQGTTFLAGEEIHGSHHLWIVINKPEEHSNTALFVNVTTLREQSEKACVLNPGEHPFISRASCIRFASAKTAAVAQLEQLERDGKIIPKEAASETLVERIRAAARASVMLPQKFLNYL